MLIHTPSLGEFMAFFRLNLILEYTVTCSTVAAGWSGYVVGLLDIRRIKFIHRF